MQPTPRAAAQAAVDPRRESEGRAHFEAGRDAFSEGRFAAALDEFKQAYELTQRPVLLYDIATSADRLRYDREALEAFELYLVKVPTPPNLAEIQARIAVLRETVNRQTANDVANRQTMTSPASAPASAAPLSAAPETTAKPASMSATHERTIPEPAALAPAAVARAAERDERRSTVMPWVVIGVSAGAMLAGGVLLAVAASRMYQVEHASKGTTFDQIRGTHDSIPALSIAGFVSLGVGAAGAAAGLTWKLLPEDKKAPEAATASFKLVPGGARLSGKF